VGSGRKSRERRNAMKSYHSPEAVEIGKAVEMILGPKEDVYWDGWVLMYNLTIESVVDVDE
jgi:hypothetical protein